MITLITICWLVLQVMVGHFALYDVMYSGTPDSYSASKKHINIGGATTSSSSKDTQAVSTAVNQAPEADSHNTTTMPNPAQASATENTAAPSKPTQPPPLETTGLGLLTVFHGLIAFFLPIINMGVKANERDEKRGKVGFDCALMGLDLGYGALVASFLLTMLITMEIAGLWLFYIVKAWMGTGKQTGAGQEKKEEKEEEEKKKVESE